MPPKGMLSEEHIEDSSGDESSTSEEPQTSQQKPNGAIRPGAIRPASPADVDRVSDSDNESTSNDDGSGSESSSSKSVSSMQSKRKAHPVSTLMGQSPSKKQKVDYNKIKRIEATTYAPPQGYSAISMKSSDVAALTSFDDLEGKQIWHLSAPSTMSMSEIKTLDITTALKGAASMVHKGVSYEMSPITTEGVTVLLPSGKSGEYASKGTKVTQAFRIRESASAKTTGNAARIDYSDGVTQTLSFFATEPGQKKLPREQPQNLKARYVPYGVPVEKQVRENGAPEISNEDATMADIHAVTSVEPGNTPQRAPKHSKKAKHTSPSTEDMESDTTSAKQKRSSQMSPGIDLVASQDSNRKRTKKGKSKKIAN